MYVEMWRYFMLERKEVIQKTYRIDKKLDDALSELSQILNRTQNELIAHAIELLIKENRSWFYNEFTNEFEKKINLYKPFSEKIENYLIEFVPYDFASRAGSDLFLYRLDNEGAKTDLVLKYFIGNDPVSRHRLNTALMNIIVKLMEEYPELQNKYNIKDFVV